MARFDGQVVIITGSGSGIGRATAGLLALEGAAVVVVDRNNVGARATVELVEGRGGRGISVTGDVTAPDDVERVVRSALEAYGQVDVVVNNAAIAVGDDLLRIDPETWERDVAVTLTGTYLCTRAVLPHMIERGRGAFVNIATVNGLSALGNEAYSAAKAGVISLTKSVAMRYGRHGIRANAVAPGTVRTPAWQERVDRDPRIFDQLAQWYPLRRVGEPDDVARAVAFLASDDAAWISGVTLPVDGGLLAGNEVMVQEMFPDAARGPADG